MPPLSVQEVRAEVKGLISQGCSFVVDGSTFLAIFELLHKVEQDGAPNTEGKRFLEQLKAALMQSAPVRAKERHRD